MIYDEKKDEELKNYTNPSKVYYNRCKLYKNTPPPSDWDGVHALTDK